MYKPITTQARLRGFQAKKNLVEAEGGCFSTEEAAEFLGITPQAVKKRCDTGVILALPSVRTYLYPVWQFSEGRTLPNIENVLKSFAVGDPWMQVAWFLNPHDRLQGRSPLVALKEGDVELVMQAARMYGEQGAV